MSKPFQPCHPLTFQTHHFSNILPNIGPGRHAERDLSDCAKQLVFKPVDDYNSHISTKILLKAQDIVGLDRD